jgi:hypothetical protein
VTAPAEETRLTRRDALAALAAGGVGLGGSAVLLSEGLEDSAGGDLDDDAIETLGAVAEAVYPSAVQAEDSFVRTYVRGLPPERREGMADAVTALDAGARRLTGRRFAALPSASKRRSVLRRLGVDRARSAPDGTPPERILYHLVNSLLYTLFSSPRGGELVGIENPAGYPGGYGAFSRHPEDDD